MKKSIVTFFTAALMLAGTIGLCQQNAAEAELDREAAIKAFDQFTQNVKSGLTAPDAGTKAASTGKFGVVGGAPEVPFVGGGMPPMTDYDNAVRVWFELGNGRYINPRYYRFAPGEVFYVHIQSATPVYVMLYQNFTNGLPSKRVYPDARFPQSYQMVMPGVSTRLPVVFATDMNYRPEHMSIVVTRGDWSGISAYVPQAAQVATQASAYAYDAGGNILASATATAQVHGVMKGAEIQNEEAMAKFAIINTAGINNTEYQMDDGSKFRLRCRVSYAPRHVRPAYYVRYVNRRPVYVNVTNVMNMNYLVDRGCYHNINDAAMYLFSDNGVGQMQITLHKIASNHRWHY